MVIAPKIIVMYKLHSLFALNMATSIYKSK